MNHISKDTPLFSNLDDDQISTVDTIDEDKADKFVFEVVDFNISDRPKTCLEVDFPILKVNEIALIENNAPKPIFTMSKWWARRRSSIFRQLLLSSAVKAPDSHEKAAQASWNLMYRKSHKVHRKFSNLKVVDIFMGGGTTVVEAARLGFKTIGVDINPIAWWVVYNETHPVEPERIEEYYEYLKQAIEPQLKPFYTLRSPRGFDGNWISIDTGEIADVDLTKCKPQERLGYEWKGPESIYTFWVKHLMCSDPSCNHLTPQLRTNLLASKSLNIKCIQDCVCPMNSCGQVFDLELSDFRLDPTAQFVISDNEKAFTSLNKDGASQCPHCKTQLSRDWIANLKERRNKGKSKKITHHLILDKKWVKGICAQSKSQFGGYLDSEIEKTEVWFNQRKTDLRFIEVRGDVESKYLVSNFLVKVDPKSGNSKMTGLLVCGGCGLAQDPINSIKISGHLARQFPYLIQGYDPEADKNEYISYGGRFFGIPDFDLIISAIREQASRDDLKSYIPKNEIPKGCETHQRKNLPAHFYTHWYKMFNERQLYVHSLILKTIEETPDDVANVSLKSQILGGFQNYIRHNCLFTIWDGSRDCLAPHFSNNNYHPKATSVENSVFPKLGRGNFQSCIKNVAKGNAFANETYDLMVDQSESSRKSSKVISKDKIDSNNIDLICGSSTSIRELTDASVDLVVTDPPFGDNLNYAELADFFLAWLQKPLRRLFPEIFQSQESPKRLEAISNRIRHPGKKEDGTYKADFEYDRLLTLCWREAFRILKPGGILTFTFHHDKDVAWIGVLDSLFKAGFTIECTFPIRSDSTKGEGKGAFGSKKIEFDIVHVCRKRLESPKPVYWATLRRNIIDSVKSQASILAQHRSSGLHLADIEVIIRGEVLEQYSKHYGNVRKNLAGDLIDVREILLEANSIAASLLRQEDSSRVPETISAETKIFFSLFRDSLQIEQSAARKRLKGSGMALEELTANGWIEIKKENGKRIAEVLSPLDRWNSLSRKKSFRSDLDQAHYIINSCIPNRKQSGEFVDLETWIVNHYKEILPSTRDVLEYVSSSHFGSGLNQALEPAIRIFDRTISNIKDNDGEFKSTMAQKSLFDD